MALKIKTAYFSTFRSGFRKIRWQPYAELHGLKRNGFDIDCKNEWAIFTRWISFTGPLLCTIEHTGLAGDPMELLYLTSIYLFIAFSNPVGGIMPLSLSHPIFLSFPPSISPTLFLPSYALCGDALRQPFQWLHIRKGHRPGEGALKCNLTGRCPFLRISFREKICISIPCFGIIRLQKIPKTIGKTIVYCSWKQYPTVFEQIVITCFGISYQFSHPVQEFMLKNDTLKKRHVPYRFIWTPCAGGTCFLKRCVASDIHAVFTRILCGTNLFLFSKVQSWSSQVSLRTLFSDSNCWQMFFKIWDYVSCNISNLKKSPFSIFSWGHTLKGFDRQTWWFVNFTHFRLTDYF